MTLLVVLDGEPEPLRLIGTLRYDDDLFKYGIFVFSGLVECVVENGTPRASAC